VTDCHPELMTNWPQASPVCVSPLAVGAVRVSADLFPDEARHGTLVRDVDTATARHIAIELLQACEEAERLQASRDL
jgi:hypothetical protein